MQTLYARKEPTTCAITLAQPAKPGAGQRDVVIYRNPNATGLPVARFPWHYSNTKPTRRNRYVTLGCVRYALTWLPDA
jgi:hypothetical protein